MEVKIGYLHGEFEKGEVPKGFLGKLKMLENAQEYKLSSVGYHICEYCQETTSSSENMAEPYTWPDMLSHYIEVHHYKPPQDFIGFVINFAT